ncbi:MAG: DUF4263 domain-containing protein [Chloroflexi bacterium]|nr:DUF4263 domain-containing protein [Chloroflexota bacterium]
MPMHPRTEPISFQGWSPPGVGNIPEALAAKGLHLSEKAYEACKAIFATARRVGSDVYSELALHGLIRANTVARPALQNLGIPIAAFQRRLLEKNRQAAGDSWFPQSEKYWSAAFENNSWLLDTSIARAIVARRDTINSSDLLMSLLELRHHPDWTEDEDSHPAFEEILHEFRVRAEEVEKQIKYLAWAEPFVENIVYSLQMENNKFFIRRLNLFDAYTVFDERANAGEHFFVAKVSINEDHPLFLPTEVAELEWLINKPDISELQLQRFFERHPKFLLGSEYKALHSQLVVCSDSGNTLVPDFFIERIGSSFADIIDLKKPNEALLNGPHNRVGFSRAMTLALNQLREYRNYFEDRENRARFYRLYGLNVFRPKVTVVIGRGPGFYDDMERRSVLDEYKNLNVITYDDLLVRARARSLVLPKSAQGKLVSELRGHS